MPGFAQNYQNIVISQKMIQIWGVLLAIIFNDRKRKNTAQSTLSNSTILLVLDECYPITKFLCEANGVIYTTAQEFFKGQDNKPFLAECNNLILQTNWHIEKSKKYFFYDDVNKKIKAKRIWFWSDALRNVSHFHEDKTIQFARQRACLNKSPLENPPPIKVIKKRRIRRFFAAMTPFDQLTEPEKINLKEFKKIKLNDLIVFQRYFGFWKYSFTSDHSMNSFADYICKEHLELPTRNIKTIHLIEDSRCIKPFTICMTNALRKYANVNIISLDSKLPSEYFILKAGVPKKVYIYSYSGGAGVNLAINKFDTSRIIYKLVEDNGMNFFKFEDGLKMINDDTRYYMDTINHL